ncbi:hypothetical protein [Psychrobacter phenylpyruvicus]|uniref:Uncharacterized protein n=1 Tax=Psychrobacter phenylpyruvicus TaxID=29432 RepID=A0A379LLN4_9GAMM|nr:hypothetical protein [Psychrobacter phenylpyruvicus]SUD90692.1 Uncharacterised protein [Psychrobacter phenylpyruvicus]
MATLIILACTGVIIFWKIKGHPYLTAIIKCFIFVLAIILSGIASDQYRNLTLEVLKRNSIFILLIFVVLVPIALFGVKVRQIIREDLENPK